MQLEFYLIENCAPTLASLKTASLFRCPCREEEDVFDALYRWNREFSRKGLRAVLLKRFTGSALIYVYRRSQLERDLKENGAKQLLETYGYQSTDPEYALNRLAGRLTSEGEFPHEIGLFLGYPLEDVQGFIQNHGKNSLCTGAGRSTATSVKQESASRVLKNGRDIYRRLWNEGKSIYQLTVAA